MILDNVRALCHERGISVFSLERALKFGNGTIFAWERCSPSVEKLKAVADYFGVTVDELLRDEQNEQGT